MHCKPCNQAESGIVYILTFGSLWYRQLRAQQVDQIVLIAGDHTQDHYDGPEQTGQTNKHWRINYKIKLYILCCKFRQQCYLNQSLPCMGPAGPRPCFCPILIHYLDLLIKDWMKFLPCLQFYPSHSYEILYHMTPHVTNQYARPVCLHFLLFAYWRCQLPSV